MSILEKFIIQSGHGQTSAASWSEWSNRTGIGQSTRNNTSQQRNSNFGSSSSNRATKSYGVTSAISTAGPTSIDIQRTKELEEFLNQYGLFESDMELDHRMEVLNKINKLFKQWIKDVSIKKNISPSLAERVGGKIFTFGSYRLGILTKNADIDVLCVAPRHIQRSDFFDSFVKLLKQQPEVKDFRAIEEAYVPVIKMAFDGIEIDMVFARLALKFIEEEQDLKDVNLLKNLDPKCVRSLNGYRVTDQILDLVPNKENFKLALSAIKLWAKKNGVYSNALGYLGGVSWAILIARICQLYPNAVAATIVNKFFLVFSHWPWPNPILLKRIEENKLGLQVWDPRINDDDRYHHMPIITPSYPQKNSAYNISLSTKNIIIESIKLGLSISKDIMSGKEDWSKLFDTPNFFIKYNHFIVLIATARNEEHQLKWCGLIQSKIRMLVSSIQNYNCIDIVHLNTETFNPIKQTLNEIQSIWFIGLKFKPIENVKLKVDFTSDIQLFINKIIYQAVKNKIFDDGMKIQAKHIKRKELNNYLPSNILNMHKKKKRSSVTPNSTPQSSPGTTLTYSDRKSNLNSTVLTSSDSNLSISGNKIDNEDSISIHKRRRDSCDNETEVKRSRFSESDTSSSFTLFGIASDQSDVRIPFLEKTNEDSESTTNDSQINEMNVSINKSDCNSLSESSLTKFDDTTLCPAPEYSKI